MTISPQPSAEALFNQSVDNFRLANLPVLKYKPTWWDWMKKWLYRLKALISWKWQRRGCWIGGHAWELGPNVVNEEKQYLGTWGRCQKCGKNDVRIEMPLGTDLSHIPMQPLPGRPMN